MPDDDPPEPPSRNPPGPTQKEVLARYQQRSRWPGLSRVFGLDPSVDYEAERLAEAEWQRLAVQNNQSTEWIDPNDERIGRVSPKPARNAEMAAPMHTRDRRFWVVLGIWAAIAVTAFGTGIGAFVSGSPHWGFGLCALGLVGAAVATLHLLETRRMVPQQSHVSAVMVLIAMVTWIFVGWQTWLWFRTPTQGYTQAQLDKSTEDGKAAQKAADLNNPSPSLKRQLEEANRDLQNAREIILGLQGELVDMTRQRNAALKQNPPPALHPPPTMPDSSGLHVFTSKTVPQLLVLCTNRTQLQCPSFFAGEIGKWLNVEGAVRSVWENGPYIDVQLWADNQFVVCHFDKEWRDRLNTFHPPDTMKVTGRIAATQGPGQLYVEACELRD